MKEIQNNGQRRRSLETGKRRPKKGHLLSRSTNVALGGTNVTTEIKLKSLNRIIHKNVSKYKLLQNIPTIDKTHTIEINDKITLQEVLKQYAPKDIFKIDKKICGKPQILGISISALRSLDLINSLPDFKTKIPMAKLFSKHFKLTEHIEYLNKSPFKIGFGTPQRILKLIEHGSLDLSRLKIFIIDLYTDSKNRTVLDMDGTSLDSTKLLLDYIFPLLQPNDSKLLLI